jgi:hypothetical protein
LYTRRTILNYINYDVKNRWNSGNYFCHPVQDSSPSLSKKSEDNFVCGFYECETWSVTTREEQRVKLSENMVLRRIF